MLRSTGTASGIKKAFSASENQGPRQVSSQKTGRLCLSAQTGNKIRKTNRTAGVALRGSACLKEYFYGLFLLIFFTDMLVIDYPFNHIGYGFINAHRMIIKLFLGFFVGEITI